MAANVPTNTIYYYFGDQIGSLRTVTDASGNVCFNGDYTPLGYRNSYTYFCMQEFGFAGMKFEAEIPAYNTMFREYSPGQGRWLSPDPVRGKSNNPQSLNLYPYVRNMPVSSIDPKGLMMDDACDSFKLFADPGLCPVGTGPSGPGGGWGGGTSAQNGPMDGGYGGGDPGAGSGGCSGGSDPGSSIGSGFGSIWSTTATYCECYRMTAKPIFATCEFACSCSAVGGGYAEPVIGAAIFNMDTLRSACGPIYFCPEMISTNTTASSIFGITITSRVYISSCVP